MSAKQSRKKTMNNEDAVLFAEVMNAFAFFGTEMLFLSEINVSFVWIWYWDWTRFHELFRHCQKSQNYGIFNFFNNEKTIPYFQGCKHNNNGQRVRNAANCFWIQLFDWWNRDVNGLEHCVDHVEAQVVEAAIRK